MAARSEMPDNQSSLADISDQDLLARYHAARSPAVFSRIVERHGSMVLRTAFRLVGNWHDAEDVTQAVFLVLAQQAGLVKSTLGGWLHKVTRDVSIQMLRARARRARREESAVRQKATDGPAAESNLREELDLVLVQLPERLREAVVLRYLEGYGQEEAARMAGCDKGTLSRRCTQGLSRLGSLLSRRGVLVAPAVLTSFLANQAAASMPAATLSALQGIGIGGAVASTQAAMLAKGALHAMFWAKLKLCTAMVAIVAAVGVAAPLVVTSATPAKVEEKPNQVLFRFDFEDGKLPALFSAGNVVQGPPRTGNRFCIESVLGPKGHVFLQREPALFTYTEDLALVFDVWVDARVSTLDLHFWNRTQQASQGVEPLRIPSERWVEGVVVPIANFRSGGNGPRSGDAIVSLAIQTGQVNGKLYIDNLELVRRPGPPDK
jgi:RNA polymerase sigma factor (sigma-70 family)